MFKPSFITPADIRHLSVLVRYRFKLTYMITGKKNRVLNYLTVSNLKLDDVLGKSSRFITEYMLAHPVKLFDVASFVDGRYKTPVEEIQSALNLIRTVLGFDKNLMTAIQVLSEIGGDMSVFLTAKHLVSWAGHCPRNDQSNKKIKSTRIFRANSYFKLVLVQVANALLHSKRHPEITDRYKRIKARRNHKKAIIAICRMLLTAIWHILSDLKPYTSKVF